MTLHPSTVKFDSDHSLRALPTGVRHTWLLRCLGRATSQLAAASRWTRTVDHVSEFIEHARKMCAGAHSPLSWYHPSWLNLAAQGELNSQLDPMQRLLLSSALALKIAMEKFSHGAWSAVIHQCSLSTQLSAQVLMMAQGYTRDEVENDSKKMIEDMFRSILVAELEAQVRA